MNARTALPFLCLSSFAFVAACDPLSAHPGDDFRVQVDSGGATTTDGTPLLTLHQRVEPVAIDFRVDGCASVTATVQASSRTETPLDVTSKGGGAFTAAVPVDSLHAPDEYCGYDAAHPMLGYVTLNVRCNDDGRETGTTFQTSWAPAWRSAYRGRGPSDAVFPGPTGSAFFDVGSGWLERFSDASTDGADGEIPLSVSGSARPLLATTPDGTLFLHGGCPIGDCGLFSILDSPSEKVYTAAGLLQEVSFASGRAEFVRDVTVPQQAIDLAADPDGTVTLITEQASSVLVTRVVDATTTATALDGERMPTRYATRAGRRVFLDLVDDGHARLHTADGTTVGDARIPGDGAVSYLSLAPDGTAFVVFRGAKPWVVELAAAESSDLTGAAAPLASDLDGLVTQTAEDSSFGAAWTSNGIAIRNRKRVEAYARTAPNARAWAWDAPTEDVIGALPLGDRVVVQTQRGIDILDASGKIVGGADPMPPACALDFQPRHAAIVGPDTVALSGRSAVYELKATLP